MKLKALAAVAALAAAVLQVPPATRTIELALTEGTSFAASASPNRQWIAFDLIGSIWVMPIGGGEAHRITPPLLEARQPTWSPDSNTIAFQGYDDGTWHIYAVPRAGGDARAITNGEFDDREPAWSHRGSRVAFSSDRSGGISTIWEVDAEAGDVRQVSKRDGWMPIWSPNDRELTFVSSDEVGGDGAAVAPARRRPGMWAVDADGRERLMIETRRQMVPAAAAWNPGGTQLALVTTTGQLFVGDERVGVEDVFPLRPQWISNSEFIYTADGQIRRRTANGVRTIPFSAKVSLERATYTIAHRELRPAALQPVKGIVAPAVSPDGRSVAFVALGDLWLQTRGERPVKLTDDAAVEADPAWSPDGRQLAYSSDREAPGNRGPGNENTLRLWIRDLASNSDQPVETVKGSITGTAWSPDGTHVAYLVGRRNIGVTRVRSGGRDRSGGDGTGQELGRPTWSPDSSSVAAGSLFPYSNRYREGLNQLLLFSVEPFSASANLLVRGMSAGNRQSNGPVWSPDGTQMAFVSEGRLWTIPVDVRSVAAAPPTAIADDHPESPTWEGDSRHIVYQTPFGLRRVMSDGSSLEPIPIALEWQPPQPPSRVVVHAGHVVDGVFEGLRGESDIVVEGGVIREIGGHRDDLHAGAVVDASSETVIPGLIEGHAHLDPDSGSRFGRAWLAYGITSVRIAAINPYQGLELIESFESGRREGPRVFMAGDPFDGVRAYYPGGASVRSEDDVDREIERAQAMGVDFFKTYVRLPDRLQKRVVDLAHGVGKPVTSHELYPGVAFGLDGVEHLRGTSRRGYSPKASSTGRAYKDVTETIAKSGMTLTPTIGIQGAFNARMTGDRTVLFDNRLSLFPLDVVSRLTALATARPDPLLDLRITGYEHTIKTVADAGGRIVAGTDAPIDPYGLGLHVEIESYVHAGLTAWQALQAATINAAQALGVDDQLGTIEPGKLADLTFITGDPLSDIRTTRNVTRVMKGGRMYTVKDLLKP